MKNSFACFVTMLPQTCISILLFIWQSCNTNVITSMATCCCICNEHFLPLRGKGSCHPRKVLVIPTYPLVSLYIRMNSKLAISIDDNVDYVPIVSDLLATTLLHMYHMLLFTHIKYTIKAFPDLGGHCVFRYRLC
jgi:hypothetical protein